MSTTQRPVTLGTGAEWRRRREDDGALPSPHNGVSHDGVSHNGEALPPAHNGVSHDGVSHNGEALPPAHNGVSHDGVSHNGEALPPAHNGVSHDGVSHNGEALPPAHNGVSHNGVSHNGEALPPAHNGEDLSRDGKLAPDGFRVPAYTAGVPSQQVASNGFAQAQQAGLAAILSISSAAAPPKPRPAAPPKPRPAAPPKPRPAAPPKPRPAAVIERPAIAIQPAAGLGEAVAAGPADSAEHTAGPQRGGSPSAIGALPLTVIVTVQFVLSLRLVTRNTAFTDEALYLWAGRLEWSHWLHHTSLPAFPTYFSGAPVVYPPVAALANSVGGLTGARVLSLCFMLGATVLLHGVTRRVFDRQSAAFAAALFAALGSAQFLGAFATYDAMALFLLAASTWLGIRAASCRTARARLGLILVAALALAVADATKYAAALFDPVVLIVIACAHWRQLGRLAGAVTALLAAGGTALGIGAALAWGGEPYVTGIMTTTLSRQPGNWPIFGILFVSAGWVGAIAVLAAIGAVAVSCARRPAPIWVLAWVLAAATFLAPAEQARIQVFTSLFKHVAFGGWFGAVTAGYALTAFVRAVPAVKSRGAFKVVTAAIAATTVSGSMLAINHFGTWQNIRPVLPALAATLRAHPGALLTDQAPPLYYYLEEYEPWQLLTSIPDSSAWALSRDIGQRRAAYILLSFAVGGGGCGNEDPSVKQTQAQCLHNIDLRVLYRIISDGGYRLIARIPYRTTSFRSDYMLWAREGLRR